MTNDTTTQRCVICDKKLNPKTMVWIEMHVNGEWAVPGEAEWSDTNLSQGCFPSGRACAKKAIAGKP